MLHNNLGNFMTTHPLWMTAKDWMSSSYFTEYSRGGTFGALFTPGRQVNTNTTFPLYPHTELMFRVEENNGFQAYHCDESKTFWAYCRVVDYTSDLSLRTSDEILMSQAGWERYNIYGISDKLLAKIGVTNKTVKASDGTLCSRSMLTYAEYQKLMENDIAGTLRWELDKKVMEAVTERPQTKETPHFEKPIKIYVAGCDDASYTEILATLEEAMQRLDSWKTNPPSYQWPGSVFTN